MDSLPPASPAALPAGGHAPLEIRANPMQAGSDLLKRVFGAIR